jgi:hypothetical protein
MADAAHGVRTVEARPARAPISHAEDDLSEGGQERFFALRGQRKCLKRLNSAKEIKGNPRFFL